LPLMYATARESVMRDRLARAAGNASFLSGVLDDDVGKLAREIFGSLGDEHGRLAGDFLVDRRDLAVWVGDHGRPAGVSLLADLDVERQAAEERHLIVRAHALGAALAEDRFGMTAIRADMHRHILHHADDRHADLLEHLEA